MDTKEKSSHYIGTDEGTILSEKLRAKSVKPSLKFKLVLNSTLGSKLCTLNF